MSELNTKNKVELSIVAVLTLLSIINKELEILNEQLSKTFNYAIVVFIIVIALIYFNRWLSIAIGEEK